MMHCNPAISHNRLLGPEKSIFRIRAKKLILLFRIQCVTQFSGRCHKGFFNFVDLFRENEKTGGNYRTRLPGTGMMVKLPQVDLSTRHISDKNGATGHKPDNLALFADPRRHHDYPLGVFHTKPRNFRQHSLNPYLQALENQNGFQFFQGKIYNLL
jgi:hypothetical protein